MPELPAKKVGIISCSGEEIPEGTISRLAALRVLQKLRPGETVTICLPLFLAGGEGDRAFAKYYPTIAVDGCEKRCAYHGTERYSNRPAASIVITDLMREQNLECPTGKRKLDPAGVRITDAAAQQIAAQVDAILEQDWNRRTGSFGPGKAATPTTPAEDEVVATCSCGSGIPVQTLTINGQAQTLIALPVIFQNLYDAGKASSDSVLAEIMEMVHIYNGIDPADEAAVRLAVEQAFRIYCQKREVPRE